MKRSNLLLGLTTGVLALASFAFAKSNSKSQIHTAKCRTVLAPSHAQCLAWTPIVASYVKTAIGQKCNNQTGTLVTAANCFSTLRTTVD